MTTPALPNPPKIEELESIRGVAALLVVFFHIPKWHPLLASSVIANGYLMVDLFFVLSGFVIFNAYAGRIGSGRDLMRFQFLRFGRLYPVHVLFLLAFLLIETAKYLAQARLGLASTSRAPFHENNLQAFVENVFLVQSVLPNRPHTFNYPAWSISVEFYTYLVFALIALWFRPLKVAAFGALALGALALLAGRVTFGFEPLLRCFAGFFVGCLTASITRQSKLRPPAFVSIAVLVAIVLFLLLKPTRNPDLPFELLDLPIYFLTAALIGSLVLSPGGMLNRLLNVKVLTWLGAISYSVYMSHAAIIWTISQVFRVVLKKPETIGPDGNSMAQLTPVESLVACLVILSLVLVASTLAYAYLEKPLRERSRRFAARRLN